MTRRRSRSLIQICVYLAFIAVTVAADQEKCDKTKCPGPLAYYNALGCNPVYENEGDCCATKYNCDHLKKKYASKCYVNGKEYEIGEKIKEEDANPCDINCYCTAIDGVASFTCPLVNCFLGPDHPGCYRKQSLSQCCRGEEVCPEKPEDRATCIVNGEEYKDGDHFFVENEPDLNCICQPGYEGKNVEPFCAKPKRSCSPDFRHASDIVHNCPPIYYFYESPQTDCSVFSRCQNDEDVIISNDSESTTNSDDGDVCRFGNMTMRRGDELSQGTGYSECVKCVCEVPPVLTCIRHLPGDKCHK